MDLRRSTQKHFVGQYAETDWAPLERPAWILPDPVFDAELAPLCSFPSIPLDHPEPGRSEAYKEARDARVAAKHRRRAEKIRRRREERDEERRRKLEEKKSRRRQRGEESESETDNETIVEMGESDVSLSDSEPEKEEKGGVKITRRPGSDMPGYKAQVAHLPPLRPPPAHAHAGVIGIHRHTHTPIVVGRGEGAEGQANDGKESTQNELAGPSDMNVPRIRGSQPLDQDEAPASEAGCEDLSFFMGQMNWGSDSEAESQPTPRCVDVDGIKVRTEKVAWEDIELATQWAILHLLTQKMSFSFAWGNEELEKWAGFEEALANKSILACLEASASSGTPLADLMFVSRDRLITDDHSRQEVKKGFSFLLTIRQQGLIRSLDKWDRTACSGVFYHIDFEPPILKELIRKLNEARPLDQQVSLPLPSDEPNFGGLTREQAADPNYGNGQPYIQDLLPKLGLRPQNAHFHFHPRDEGDPVDNDLDAGHRAVLPGERDDIAPAPALHVMTQGFVHQSHAQGPIVQGHVGFGGSPGTRIHMAGQSSTLPPHTPRQTNVPLGTDAPVKGRNPSTNFELDGVSRPDARKAASIGSQVVSPAGKFNQPVALHAQRHGFESSHMGDPLQVQEANLGVVPHNVQLDFASSMGPANGGNYGDALVIAPRSRGQEFSCPPRTGRAQTYQQDFQDGSGLRTPQSSFVQPPPYLESRFARLQQNSEPNSALFHRRASHTTAVPESASQLHHAEIGLEPDPEETSESQQTQDRNCQPSQLTVHKGSRDNLPGQSTSGGPDQLVGNTKGEDTARAMNKNAERSGPTSDHSLPAASSASASSKRKYVRTSVAGPLAKREPSPSATRPKPIGSRSRKRGKQNTGETVESQAQKLGESQSKTRPKGSRRRNKGEGKGDGEFDAPPRPSRGRPTKKKLAASAAVKASAATGEEVKEDKVGKKRKSNKGNDGKGENKRMKKGNA